jgi:hypothetical protein
LVNKVLRGHGYETHGYLHAHSRDDPRWHLGLRVAGRTPRTRRGCLSELWVPTGHSRVCQLPTKREHREAIRGAGLVGTGLDRPRILSGATRRVMPPPECGPLCDRRPDELKPQPAHAENDYCGRQFRRRWAATAAAMTPFTFRIAGLRGRPTSPTRGPVWGPSPGVLRCGTSVIERFDEPAPDPAAPSSTQRRSPR